MNGNYEIMKLINDKLRKSSDLEFTTDLKDLTLLDLFALIKTVKVRNDL